jgi:hypothetical protein
METVLLVTTIVDCLAVLGLAWLVTRSGRERDAASADQRDVLARLQGEIAHLLGEAEARARTLEETLGARERSLRTLLREIGRAEADGATSTRGAARPAAEPRPLVRSFADGLDETDAGPDPAEVRLRRELELSLGRGRLA